ncbi:toxin-antitoxin system, toxin component, PIN family [Leptospira santarosai str. ST188]|nr:toxin-antitoxin system, toxin component, PIN family [Leptospira santarosai str. ST188]
MKATPPEKGVPIEDFDLLIVSTALYLNYTLTNNEKHFHKIPNLRTENRIRSFKNKKPKSIIRFNNRNIRSGWQKEKCY